jgi:phage replication O-like protein O
MDKNPSTNNGFFKIANELAEVLAKTSLTGSEVRILWVVLRKTWGWVQGNRRKDFDRIALSQFVLATGMKQANVVRALKSLVAYRLLLKTDKGYGINQDYSKWLVAKRLLRVASSQNDKPSSLQATESSSLQTTKISSLQATYKRKKEKKETITKESTPAKDAKMFFKGVKDLIEKIDSEESILTRVFLQKIETDYPKVPKGFIWTEIKKFYLYWTELNSTGKKERWEKQDAFQVDRRLVTWFGKIEQFKKSEINRKETKIGKI